MPAGRPSKYSKQIVAKARKLSELGATDDEIANLLDIDRSTLYQWKIDYPEFSDALKLGKEGPDERVKRSLYHRAIGYSHKAVKIFADPKTGAEKVVEYVEHYPPDSTAGIFWLKNRLPDQFRERVEHEHSISLSDRMRGLLGSSSDK